MSVRIRPYRRGGWEVDIRVLLPTGREHRERRRMSVRSNSAATRWAEARERELLVKGPRKPTKEVPTLETFGPRFLDGHARANQQKASGIAHKRPCFGSTWCRSSGRSGWTRLRPRTSSG
jgi:hypothetical protein